MAKRCKHLSVAIDEELAGAQLIEIKDGEKVFDGDGGGDLVPTGRYSVRCKDCGLRRTYTLKNRPRWLVDYVAQSIPFSIDWSLDLEPPPDSHRQANEVIE